MFIFIKNMLANVYLYVYIEERLFSILSISLLHPEELFMSNFKTARKKRFFNGATSN